MLPPHSADFQFSHYCDVLTFCVFILRLRPRATRDPGKVSAYRSELPMTASCITLNTPLPIPQKAPQLYHENLAASTP